MTQVLVSTLISPRLNPRALQSCALATGILHRAVTRSVTAGYRYFRKTHQTYPSKKSSYSTQVSAVSRVQADRYILMMFCTPSFECNALSQDSLAPRQGLSHQN